LCAQGERKDGKGESSPSYFEDPGGKGSRKLRREKEKRKGVREKGRGGKRRAPLLITFEKEEKKKQSVLSRGRRSAEF